MAISTESIKSLREVTGAGVLDCKRALEQAGGDAERAAAILREQGLTAAAKKAEREVHEGIIEAYVHAGAKVASLLELDCETDFVARTPDFRSLAHDLAMQVAAAKPIYVGKDDVPTEVVEAQKRDYLLQIADMDKPEHVKQSIIEGKLLKFYSEVCLLEQPFIKDESIKVRDLIVQAVSKMGENIIVRRFARFAVGED